MLPSVVICDDDQLMLQLLVNFCQQAALVQVIGTANTGREAIRLVRDKSPDILLLDIRLPDLNGIEVARLLYQSNSFLKIVFITGYNDYYAEAFQTYAYDYINKLNLAERLPRTLKRIQQELSLFSESQHSGKKVCISLDRREYYIDPQQVVYIRSINRKVKLVTEVGTLEVYGSLYKWKKVLASNFFSCHRSYLVNLDKIRVFEHQNGSSLVMVNGDKIPISRRKKSELKKRLSDYILN